jgi:5,10-methylenetetrahydromethanopterin reductase
VSGVAIGFASLGDAPAARVVGLARLADAEALSTLWLADEPFFRGAVPLAAACATATERIRIGLGVVNPYDHPPAWMARDFATLQELAAGRAVLGIGASWPPPIKAQGIPWTRPLAAVRDAVAIARALLAGETCHYEGAKFRADGIRLGFAPPSPPSPILVASMFPRSLAQSGEIAEGVILSVLCPATYVARAEALVSQAAERAGRTHGELEIVQYVPMEVDEDGAQARASVKRWLAFFISLSYGSDPAHWRAVAELGGFDLDEFARIYERLADGEAPEAAVPDAFLDRFAVAGTPARCLELIEAYAAAGTTELVALPPPWSDLERQVLAIGRRLGAAQTREVEL